MEKLSNVGAGLLFIGAISFLLSLVNLQFKAFNFLGEKKVYVEIGCIVIGLLILLVVRFMNKDKDVNETKSEEQKIN
jgi:hypothetical protein